MNHVYYTETKQPIELGERLAGGGEGDIYEIKNQPASLAKIYKPAKRSLEKENKLKTMILNPPKDPMKAAKHISIAWPINILYHNQRFIGFIMPKIDESYSVFSLLSPTKKHHQKYNMRFTLTVAKNIAIALDALHQNDYIFGDFNESNILINDQALATFIDTDSYQVKNKQNNIIYHCEVGKPEYIAPELHGQQIKDATLSIYHDSFSLAVLIFQLLMDGWHPYQGKLKDLTQSIDRVDVYAIKKGLFPYVDNPELEPSPAAPSFEILSPELQKLFTKCFVDGHSIQSARPTPKEWINAIIKAEKKLKACKKNKSHHYSKHLGKKCPWCERESNMPSSNKDYAGKQTPFRSISETRSWLQTIIKPSGYGFISGIGFILLSMFSFNNPDLMGQIMSVGLFLIIATVGLFILGMNEEGCGCLIFIGLIGAGISNYSSFNDFFSTYLKENKLILPQAYIYILVLSSFIGLTWGNWRYLQQNKFSFLSSFIFITFLFAPTLLIWQNDTVQMPIQSIVTPTVESQENNTELEPTPEQQLPMPNVIQITPSPVQESTTSLCESKYIVQPNDSLRGIAGQFLGSQNNYQIIITATVNAKDTFPNQGFVPPFDEVIRPGDVLCIPPA